MDSRNLANQKELQRKLVYLRLAQQLINEHYKNNEFHVPIHLAFGHESIALSVSENMQVADQLVLPHRNIHYHLACGAEYRELLNEYRLNPSGLARGSQGSMNLSNHRAGIVYSSSILGNNFGVGLGLAMSCRLCGNEGVVFIVTGDGAIEEGSFYETLLMFTAQSLPGIIVVENNGWSLGSSIDQRREAINLRSLAGAVGAEYAKLTGNDAVQYTKAIYQLRLESLVNSRPIVVEVMLKTLGDRVIKSEQFPDGKYINYHAGPAPTVDLDQGLFIVESDDDPLFVSLANDRDEVDLLRDQMLPLLLGDR